MSATVVAGFDNRSNEPLDANYIVDDFAGLAALRFYHEGMVRWVRSEGWYYILKADLVTWRVLPKGKGVERWVAGTYSEFDLVLHSGRLYESQVDGNSDEPGSDEDFWQTVSSNHADLLAIAEGAQPRENQRLSTDNWVFFEKMSAAEDISAPKLNLSKDGHIVSIEAADLTADRILTAPNEDGQLATMANVADADAATLASAKAYADGAAISVYKDCGNWDASGGNFPTTGGTGVGGAIKAANSFEISNAGIMGGEAFESGDVIRALVDAPGQTLANWARTEHNLQQATESNRGTAKIVSQATIQTETSTDDQAVVTTKKWWQGIARFIDIAQTITGNWNFTGTLKQAGSDVITWASLNGSGYFGLGPTITIAPHTIDILNDQSGDHFGIVCSKESNAATEALIFTKNGAACAGIGFGFIKTYNTGSGNDAAGMFSDGSIRATNSISGITEATAENSDKMASTAFVRNALAALCPVQLRVGHLVTQTNYATICYYNVGADDASFQVSASVYDCTLASNKLSVQVDYTNPSGANQSSWLSYFPAWGTNTNALGANGYTVDGACMPIEIRAKAGSTIILKVATNEAPGAAYPGGTYSASGRIMSLPEV
jgi:hypothetical protein